MKVEQFYNKNQFIITGKEGIYFQSYSSTIAIIDNKGNLTFGYCWDYSHTTMKHLYLFLNNYYSYLNQDLQKNLKTLQIEANKRKYLQKLIDSKLIKYNENLK